MAYVIVLRAKTAGWVGGAGNWLVHTNFGVGTSRSDGLDRPAAGRK